MGHIIKVKSGLEYNTYSTFGAAVDAANKSREEIKEECSLINGVVVTEYQFNGTECVISFENNRHLLVTPGRSSIKWKVINEKPNIGNLEKKDVILELPGGIQFDWNYESVLNNFVGKKATISPSDQLLFIWSENRIEHLFSYCVDVSDSKKIYLTIGEA